MPSLYIRFVSGKGWDSKLIEWYSRCSWSHVELLLGELTFGAQLKGGLGWRNIHDKCYSKAQGYEVWEIPITTSQEEQLYRLTEDATGTPYDWPAILSFILGPHRLHLKGRYICSGFLAAILKYLNLAIIDMNIENYEPAHIRMLVPNIPNSTKVNSTKL